MLGLQGWVTPGTRTPGTPWSREGGGHQAAAPKVASLLPATAATSCLPPLNTGSVPLSLAGTAAPWCKRNCCVVPMAGSRDRLSPAAPSPEHLCFMGTFTAKLQVSALCLFICVLVHRKGRWVLTPEAPKRARARLGAQGCRRGGLERRAQTPPCSCLALSCCQPALPGDVLPSLEKTAARQPHGPKMQPSFGSRWCEHSPAAAGVPPL